MRTKVQAFRECDTCASKSGSPVLCAGCLNNRALISQLEGDEKRFDYLQKLLGRNRCILRMSSSGRGFRLHQTTRPEGEYSIRLAIDMFMRKNPEPSADANT